MIISDLQYIESANETEVEGGIRPALNEAYADGRAEAFGRNTFASTYTHTLVIEGNYSGAGSSSASVSY